MKKKILILVIVGLILIPPSIALAADISIETVAKTAASYSFRNGIYWVSDEVGYYIYYDNTCGVGYEKTTDGGLTWNGQISIYAVAGFHFNTWADWNTPDDNGTKIHIVILSQSADQIYYTYLDTFDDSTVTPVLVESVPDVLSTQNIANSYLSIVKTQNSELAISYRTDGSVTDAYGFEISNDGGNTWVTKDSPWETAFDHFDLYPGNENDPSDIWGVFWDISTDELSLKTYDASSDSWTEQLISANMYDDDDQYINMSGDIKQNNGHLYLAAWDRFSTTNTTLKVWEINGSANITELTEVISNDDGYFQTDIFIDQSTNTLYTSYLKGTIESTVGVYYQKSVDNGLTWGGEITFSETNDDHRCVKTSGIKESLGGKYMPVWLNDDTSIFTTNYIHSITISANLFTDPAIAPEYVIDCPTCTDNLSSSGNFTSNETFTGGPPGFAVVDEAAEESGAPPIWLWGWIGMFSIMVPGFFITYMERKYGAGNGNLILRIALALIVLGLLVTWGRFDWWMIVLYIMVAIAPALMSRQYDWGGAGGVSQQGWIGFCATSWIGLTIINRILEGQFLTSSESSWWCSIQLFNEFKVFDLFTLPVLNFQFFTVGIPSLLRWDYSFFGGNAEMIQYFLYTVTAVVAFILFVIMIGLLFNAFRAR